MRSMANGQVGGVATSVLEGNPAAHKTKHESEISYDKRGFSSFDLMGIGSMPRSNSGDWIKYLETYGCAVEPAVQEYVSSDPQFPILPRVHLVKTFVLGGHLISPEPVTASGMNSFALREQLKIPSPALMCGFASRMTDDHMKKMAVDRIVLLHKPVTLRSGRSSVNIEYVLALQAGSQRRNTKRMLMFVPLPVKFVSDTRRGFLYTE